MDFWKKNEIDLGSEESVVHYIEKERNVRQLIYDLKFFEKLTNGNELTKEQITELKQYANELIKQYPNQDNRLIVKTPSGIKYGKYVSDEEQEYNIKKRAELYKEKKNVLINTNILLNKNKEKYISLIKETLEKKRELSKQETKAKHKDYMNEKVPCECGVIVIRKNKTIHKKTNQTHILYIQRLQEAKDKKMKRLRKQEEEQKKQDEEKEAELKRINDLEAKRKPSFLDIRSSFY